MKTRILLLEDNAADRVIVTEALEEASDRWGDFEVVEAEDLRAAVAALETREVDCALVDLGLPDASGTDVIDRLQLTHAHIPLVVLSGADETVVANSALRHGAQDYISKTADLDGEGLARTIRFAIDRAEANAALVESNRQLASFAGRIAHDLRSPLAVTTGMLQLLERKGDESFDDELKFLLSRAIAGSQRASDMVSSLLMYAQAIYPDTATDEVDLDDVAEWARETAMLERPDATIEIEGDLPTVTVNEGAIRQAFINVIQNALKYAADDRPPVVRIRTGPRSISAVEVDIVDNGIGIDPADRDTVFDEGTQLDKTREGFGLGLPAVRAIVERFDGEVWIDAGDDGVGTTVAMRFRTPI